MNAHNIPPGDAKEFLRKLADLSEEFKATFTYTTDDDGIHIELDGKLVFAGHLDTNADVYLRQACDHIKKGNI